jgi:hypothetical protein
MAGVRLKTIPVVGTLREVHSRRLASAEHSMPTVLLAAEAEMCPAGAWAGQE